MRLWGNSLDDAGSFVPMDAKNHGSYIDDYYTDDKIAGLSAVVPSSAPYILVLDFVPLRNSLTVTVNSSPAVIREWGNPPVAAGEVSVNFVTGEIMFHEDSAGDSVSAVYYHSGTVIDANWFNALQKAVDDGIGAPVQSVNGKTGAVVLTYTDVGAQGSSGFLQSIASATSGGLMTAIGGSGYSMTPRTLTAGTGINVNNGNGQSGNPTVAVNTAAALTWTGAQTFNGLVKLLGGIVGQYRSLVSSSANVIQALDLTDFYVRCTATSASYNCQITLPATAGRGHMVLVANIENMQKATQVSAPSGESILGVTNPMTLSTTVGNAWLFIRNHGSSWDWIKLGA